MKYYIYIVIPLKTCFEYAICQVRQKIDVHIFEAFVQKFRKAQPIDIIQCLRNRFVFKIYLRKVSCFSKSKSFSEKSSRDSNLLSAIKWFSRYENGFSTFPLDHGWRTSDRDC